jgi:hypothetical protein
MKEKKNSAETVKSKATRVTYIFLAFGFTLISLWTGFSLYSVLFGIILATLISIVFEIARLASLYSILSKKRMRTISIPTYLIVATVCACAAVSSFTYEVIKRDQQIQEDHARQIRDIKQVYSAKIEQELTVIKRDIQKAEREVARRPWSGYWKRCHVQAITNRDNMITQRNTFLEAEPANPEHWINSKAPMLGIKREEPKRDSKNMIAVTAALKEFWGLDSSTVKKITGIVLTVVVEMAILILAFLGSGKGDDEVKRDIRDKRDKAKNVTKKITAKMESLSSVTSGIDEITLQKFVEANREHFNGTGKLLPMRKLSPNMRSIRDSLKGFNRKELKELFA